MCCAWFVEMIAPLQVQSGTTKFSQIYVKIKLQKVLANRETYCFQILTIFVLKMYLINLIFEKIHENIVKFLYLPSVMTVVRFGKRFFFVPAENLVRNISK